MVARRAPSSPAPAAPSTISLPKLVTDPVWSLKPWPVVVTISGEDVSIPAMYAADWLQLLMTDLHPDDVFPGLLGEGDRAYVEDCLHAGDVEYEDVQRLALDIISTVSARPWWVAMRLIAVAQQSWDALGGDMTVIDPERRPLAAWLDYLFLLIVRNIDDKKRTMFLLKLEVIPEGRGEPTKEVEMSADAFLALGE